MKCLMGCKIFWKTFQTEVRIPYSFTTNILSVSAMFIRQERSHLKMVMMILVFDDSPSCSNLIHFMFRLCFLVCKFL